MGRDAVYIGVKHGAGPELVAELVVRCLKMPEREDDFNGWTYLLQNDRCSRYVEAVIKLVQEEASCRLHNSESSEITKQFTSPGQEAVGWLAMSVDSKKRIAINVATPMHRELLEKSMLYLGRFMYHRSGGAAQRNPS